MSVRHALVRVVDVVLVLGALVVGGLAVVRQFRPEWLRTKPVPRELGKQKVATGVGALMGSDSARLVLVEFSDFECPACRETARRIQSLREKYPSELAVRYRHFPLRIHPHAFDASVASECAADQHRFEAFHDAVYAQQEHIGTKPWVAFARDAGVPDIDKFASCLTSEQSASRVRTDAALASSLQLAGTPSFILAGRLYFGPSAAQLETDIAKLIADSAHRAP